MGILFVQSAHTPTSTSPASLSVSLTNVAGNLLVLEFRDGSGGGVTWTISDTLGNTWVKADLGGVARCAYVANCKAGANTITISITGSAFTAYLGVWEFSGLVLSNPLDVLTASVTNSLTRNNSNNFNTNYDNELIFSAASFSLAQPGTCTWSSFTHDSLSVLPGVGSGNTYGATGFRIVTTGQTNANTRFAMTGGTSGSSSAMTVLSFIGAGANFVNRGHLTKSGTRLRTSIWSTGGAVAQPCGPVSTPW